MSCPLPPSKITVLFLCPVAVHAFDIYCTADQQGDYRMDQLKIGKFIAELRKSKSMTQEEMAEKLGVSNKSVSRWENGRNLPDASLFEPICELLGISLTELFCGEKIEDAEMVSKVEQNIVSTIDYTEKTARCLSRRMKAAAVLAVIAAAAMLIIINSICFTPCASHAGDVSKWQGFFPVHSAYRLELNDADMPVFADPNKALNQAKVDYSDAIEFMKGEYHLLPLSKYYYKAYGTYGWQLETNDEILQGQGNSLSNFVDIYENSFR